MNKIRFLNQITISIVLGILFLVPPNISADVVYDNTTTYLSASVRRTVHGEQWGDQILLGGTDRIVTDFMFGYALDSTTTGALIDSAIIRFYNIGSTGAPNTLLYDSGIISLSSTGSGPSSGETLTLSGLSILVPDTFVWTIENVPIIGATVNTSLLLYDPPTVGSSDPDTFWYTDSSGSWFQGGSIIGRAVNFEARVTATSAVPEPTTILLLVSGLLGVWGFRRKLKK